MVTIFSFLQLGPNVTIGKNVTIGAGVRIRESMILENSVLKVSYGSRNICITVEFYYNTVRKRFQWEGPLPRSWSSTLCFCPLGQFKWAQVRHGRVFYTFISLSRKADGACPVAPVPLTIFRLNSKFNQNRLCSGLKCTLPITTKFCTCHDSVTVVACAKFCCDWIGLDWIGLDWIGLDFCCDWIRIF